jgi:integrase
MFGEMEALQWGIPCSLSAAEILDRRRTEAGRTHIFPRQPRAPLCDVRKTWLSVCKRAGLEGVRIHDLRHTFTSLLASSGESLLASASCSGIQ